jgi:hypothetical protein
MTPLDTIPGIATIPAGETLQDYSNIDHQIEVMGLRLDAIRRVLAGFSKDADNSDWKYQYWKCVEARVLKKWKMMDLLRQTRLRTSYRDKTKVDYAWWEPHVGMAMNSTFLWNLNLPARLDWSWENARSEFIQKARRGLA